MRLCLRPIAPLVATIALALTCSSVTRAETIGRDRPTPSAVTIVESMRVEAYGSGSPAMVIILGLSSGSWVWDDAVRTYAKKHAVYATHARNRTGADQAGRVRACPSGTFNDGGAVGRIPDVLRVALRRSAERARRAD